MSLRKRSVKSPATAKKGARTVVPLRRSSIRPQASEAETVTDPHSGVSVAQVRQGLPMRDLEDLAGILHLDQSVLAQVIGLSVRTLQRRSSERLGPAVSDRLARVRRIFALATQILGESAKAALWLTTHSRVLGDVPLQMLDTDIGTQRVEKELRQIEFGMPV